MRTRSLLLTALALLTLGLPTSRAQDTDGGMWDLREPMPTARKEIANASVAIGGKIYVVGGVTDAGEITDALEIYDPETNGWTTGASLPLPLWRTTAAASDGTLYTFGGYQARAGFPFDPTDRVFAYDPAANAWEERSPMPVVRGTAVAVPINDRIHVFGGVNTGELDRHDIYDPALDAWTVGPALPTARSGLTAALLDGKVYVIGGYRLAGGVVSQSLVEVYDPVAQTWAEAEALPVPRLGIAAAALGGKLYVFGGAPGSPARSRTLVYDPTADVWAELAEMPSPGSFMGVAAIESTIYAIGGGAINLSPDGVDANRAFAPPSGSTDTEHGGARSPVRLHPAYPNPFSSSTRLRLTVAEPMPVTVRVYDLTGRLVATPVDGAMMSGSRILAFERGALAGGTYVVHLVTPDGTQVRRITLLP